MRNRKVKALNCFFTTYISPFGSKLKNSAFRIPANQKCSINHLPVESTNLDKLLLCKVHIHSNYYLKLDSGTLAKLIDLSNEHFRRFFKSQLGKTPVEYINYYRINIAASLLKNNDERIIDIAMKTGFENIGYFIKVFKKITKSTPSEYRKKFQNND